MASVNLSTRYRPLRVGFLVRQNSLEDLVEAAQLNTYLWGGAYNPIIPVSQENATFVKQLLVLFRVDTLYSVTDTEEVNQITTKYSYLRDPFYTAENFFTEDHRSGKKSIAYLDSINAIQYLWEEEFKHKPKRYKSKFILVDWEKNDPLGNLFSICFGNFVENDELKYNFRDTFLKGLRAKKIKLSNTEPIDPILISHYSPLSLTKYKLFGYYLPFERYSLYVGDENSFDDLINFWNLRASGINLEFLPINHIQRFYNFIQLHLEKLNNIPNQSPNFDDWISIYHHSCDFEKAKEIMEGFKHKKKLSFCYCHEISWNGLNIKPATFYFNTDSVLANVEKSYDRFKITFNLPPKKFLKDSSAPSQIFAISITPTIEFEYPEHVLKVPYIFDLNEFYSRSINLDPWKLRVQRDGIGIIIRGFESSLFLYPISNQLLIEQIFKFVGIDAELNQAGLITKRIIEKLGNVDGGRVFKIRGVRNLFKKFKSDECFTRSNATKVIWNDGQFKEHEELHIEYRKKKGMNTNDVFDFLLRHEFLRAGLQFECDNCNLSSWLPLREIDDFWICSYCGFKNQTSIHLRNRGDWMFRKSGLFAKDNNQEGALPVIITLIQFFRIFHGVNFIYTPSLNLKTDNHKCEIDFCVLQYRIETIEGNEIEIGIGECKSEGGNIDQKDIENLLIVSEKLNQIQKLKCYLIFSKASNGFTENELALFKDLESKRVPFVLLTNRELEPYEPYWVKDDIPVKFAHTMLDMVQNSYYLYLSQNAEGSNQSA